MCVLERRRTNNVPRPLSTPSPSAAPPPLPGPPQVTSLPPDMTGKQSVRSWMSKLHGMPASHELKEDDVRQLLFDLETAYNEFMSGIRLAPAR